MARPHTLSDAEILERARRAFVEFGYGARTHQVAAAVGLTWGAIAQRFGTKRALFEQAMAGHMPDADALLPRGPVHRATLRDTLERLRDTVWAHWPVHLQCRLSPAAGCFDDRPMALMCSLVAGLDAHARRGTVRRDIDAAALARMVLALVVGDVAQRYLAREPMLTPDPVFIGDVTSLLAPR